NCIFNQLALREVTKSWPLSLDMHGLKSEMSVLWRFSFPAVLCNLLVAPVMWFGQLTVIGEKGRFRKLVIATAGINVGVTAVSALALGLLGPLIMSAYGREFRSGTAVL